jgi:hypothetical protein
VWGFESPLSYQSNGPVTVQNIIAVALLEEARNRQHIKAVEVIGAITAIYTAEKERLIGYV